MIAAFVGLVLVGCNAQENVKPEPDPVNPYFAVKIADFVGHRAIPVHPGDVGAEWVEVELPMDLLLAAPEEARLVLDDSAVELEVDGVPLTPADADQEYRITVTFRLSRSGDDPCASDIEIGPFVLIINRHGVHISQPVRFLLEAARALANIGRFAMCARAHGDVDGTVELHDLRLEFGTLGDDEEPVEICHIPPGNPDQRHTISVAPSAVAAHLAHGDYLGACVEPIEDLTVVSICSDDPAVYNWTVSNPNAQEVPITWTLIDADSHGTVTVPPGGYVLTTPAEGASLEIAWLNEAGDEQTATATATGEICNDAEDDTDGDGVPDALDACPGTEAGAGVDSNGCSCTQRGDCPPEDSDADGVPDNADTCPGTAGGAVVDTNGCSCEQRGDCIADDDGDGVADEDDDCPDTPAGAAVDAAGCACMQRDTDADGVDDCLDACANTPMDGLVDSNVCACSQLDDDGDGVDNCDDLCPASAPGEVVDLSGCPTTLVDAGANVVLDEVGCVTLTGTATGGTPPYTYTWSAPEWVGANEQSTTVVPTATTTYTLTVSDWSSPPVVVSNMVTVSIRPPEVEAYTIENLGSLSSNPSYPAGINDDGDVVGYYYSEDYLKRAFLFRNGVMIDLGTLGGTEAYARDINNAGVVVGQARNAAGDWRPFRWTSGGGMEDLGTMGGDFGAAYAISENGIIVGNAEGPFGDHAFIYQDGVMSDVGTLDFFQSGAFGVNDDGQVAGTYLAWGADQQGFLYDEGFVDLGSPMLTGSRIVGINNDETMIGYSWGGGQYRAYLYACDEPAEIGTLAGFAKTYTWAINQSGQIAGSVTTADSALSHAVVYSGGQLRDLNNLLVPGHGWEYLTVAFAINNVGQVAGYGRIDGQYRAFLATPVD